LEIFGIPKESVFVSVHHVAHKKRGLGHHIEVGCEGDPLAFHSCSDLNILTQYDITTCDDREHEVGQDLGGYHIELNGFLYVVPV